MIALLLALLPGAAGLVHLPRRWLHGNAAACRNVRPPPATRHCTKSRHPFRINPASQRLADLEVAQNPIFEEAHSDGRRALRVRGDTTKKQQTKEGSHCANTSHLFMHFLIPVVLPLSGYFPGSAKFHRVGSH